MSAENPAITTLKETVEAIEQEIQMAITCHESWKPAAYDEELHKRMGFSYATHTFAIIRKALRREMLMALMRLWDSDNRTIGIHSVVKTLNDPNIFSTFLKKRVQSHGFAESLTPGVDSSRTLADGVRDALILRRSEICKLVSKYTMGGSHYSVFKKLNILRQVTLAHNQTKPKKPQHADATDEEIELFYQDSLEIVRLLLSLVLAKAHNLTETADVYKHHAQFFWAAVRGERTEGHPDYRHPSIAPIID